MRFLFVLLTLILIVLPISVLAQEDLDSQEIEINRLTRVGIEYLQQGHTRLGHDRLRNAEQQVRNRFGKFSPELAVYFLDIAEEFQQLRLYEEASRFFRKALPATAAVWGDVSLEMAGTLRRLAECQRDLERPSAAVRWYHEAIARYIFIYGGEAAEVESLQSAAAEVEKQARAETKWIDSRHASNPSALTRRVSTVNVSGLSGVGRLSRSVDTTPKKIKPRY